MTLAPVCDYSELGGRLIYRAKQVTLQSIGAQYPQHYYTYHQTPETLSRILSLITAPAGFLLFSGQDQQGLYLQVGIIGRENYVRAGKPDIAKLVYGRKWRIDSDTPTTEVVQTTLLAIQKVREHEVRELLRWTDPHHGMRATPFSCHQDINLLTLAFREAPAQPQRQADDAEFTRLVSQLRFGEHALSIAQIVPLSAGRVLIELTVNALTEEESFPELMQAPISVVLQRREIGHLLHELMDAIIALSHRYCQEHFAFCGVKRFSRDYDPRLIADVSRRSRPYQNHMADPEFADLFDRVNAAVDQQRAPHVGLATLGHYNRSILSKTSNLGGFMPKGYPSDATS